MIQTINQEQHPDYPQKFKDAVRNLFPILCYTPDETEAFIDEFEPQFDGKSAFFADAQGHLTFCRVNVKETDSRNINYIIPENWEARHTMVKATLQQIINEFLQANAAHELRMKINEKLPSHNAWYAGLLPELGFHLTPRLLMVADQGVIDQLDLPARAPDVQETAHRADQLAEATELYVQAYDANRQALPAAKLASEQAWERQYISRLYRQERTIETWTGLTHNGKLIGFSCGDVWDDELSIDEVAILPEYFDQGLGRYLTIRCMQKLHERYGGPTKYFMLGTERTNTRALKLYHRLGFTIDKVESYACFTNPLVGQ